jgi:hypothetical protein
MAYRLDPDGKIEDLGFNPKLEIIQEVVGGYIELVPTANGGYMYCNEEGKLLGLTINRPATQLIDFDDIILGSVVVMTVEDMKKDMEVEE